MDDPVDEHVRRDSSDREEVRHALDVIEVMMLSAEIQVASGMSAHDVVDTMLRVSDAYGLAHVHIDLTYNSVHIAHYRGPDILPVTALRVMESGRADYGKVRAVHDLVLAVERAGLPVEEALRRISAINDRPAGYPDWVATVGTGLIGVGVVMASTTQWRMLLYTFLAGCLLDVLLALLVRRGVPAFFRQVAGGTLMVLLAGGMDALDRRGVALFAEVNPNLVVIGGIIMLLSGSVVVSAVQDGLDHFNVTAAARMFEAVLRTVGIVVGIAAGLDIITRWGAPFELSSVEPSPGLIVSQFVGAAVLAAGVVLNSFGDRGTVLLGMAMGVLAWGAYFGLAQVGAAEAVSNSAGAFVAAFVATLLTRRSSIPGFALTTAALLPLVPGLALYDGVLQMVVADADGAALLEGARVLLGAVAVALGIAAGATLGTFWARPVVDRLGRQREQASETGEPT
jgi:uncharacterized membrane protein YjjP (DUF1212 family)